MSLVKPARTYGSAADGVNRAVGSRTVRSDGAAKVKGEARFGVEYRLANTVHAVLVPSAIAAGQVRRIDAADASTAPGVLLVLTPHNIPHLNPAADWLGTVPEASAFSPLATDISHAGQYVAAVVAETLEQATEAARLLKIEYRETPSIARLKDADPTHSVPVEWMSKAWGDAAAAFAAAPLRLELEYETQREYHVPIELHGLIAEWEGDRLTIWEPSQWPDGMARTYAEWFGIPWEKVRIVSPYVGGGFGSKGFCFAHDAIASIAAKQLDRPVKLVVTRAQSFGSIGGRPATRQTIALGAGKEGKLHAIIHSGENETSMDDIRVEPLSAVTSVMYATPNFSSRQQVSRANIALPGIKRAPGENPSAFGLESAIDELAYAVGLDPLAIRLLNYAERDPQTGKTWSTRQLREAFAAGAEAFGWSSRTHEPRSMRDGHELIGWGLATGSYPFNRTAGEALVRLLADGTVEVESSTVDLGQGSYTVIAQTAADMFGLPVEDIVVRLGDSRFPRSGMVAGSRMAAVMTEATIKAALAVREQLIDLAISHPRSPFRFLQPNTVTVADGHVRREDAEGPSIPIGEFLRIVGHEQIEALRDTFAENGTDPRERFKNFTTVALAPSHTEGDYSRYSWCAHFVEVRVDEDFGTVRVSRVVSALDSGRLYNPMLAESQWKGGIIQGIGQALLEEGVVDVRDSRVINNNLADYLIPTNADIPDIKVISVGVPDPHASPLGGKGVGELGIVGVAPAIANAVFHATGKRIRSLPITLEKLI